MKPACFEPREDLPELLGKFARQLHEANRQLNDVDRSLDSVVDLLAAMASQFDKALDALPANTTVDVELGRMMTRAAKRIAAKRQK